MPKDRGAAARALVSGLLMAAVLTLRQPVAGLTSSAVQPFVHLTFLVVAGGLGLATIRAGVQAAFSNIRGQQAVLWRNLATWTLIALLVLSLVAAAGVNLSGLLVGGAILGVVVASASQAALGNFFAGLVLMFAAPFRIGDIVRVRTAIAPVDYEGRVIDARAQHTTLLTRRGDLVRIPNSSMLNSIVIVGIQAEMDVELELADADTLDDVRRRLKKELENPSIELDLVPIAAAMTGDGDRQRITCRLHLRAPEPVDPAQVARALAAAGEVRSADPRAPNP